MRIALPLVPLLLLACGAEPAPPDTKPPPDTADTASVPDTADTADTATETGDTGPADADGDGSTVEGGDCDDADAQVHPGATEACDTRADDDCDGLVNEPDALGCTTAYVDADGDGHGTAESACACPGESGWAEVDDDCDDADAATSPSEAEVCRDHVDNNCDGGAPECVLTDRSLATADARYIGEELYDRAGYRVVGAPDIDGDGFDDLLVAAPTSGDTPYFDEGAVYLVRGGTTPVSGSLAGADARFSGDEDGGYAGASVAGLGDVDGDGLGDVLIGAPSRGGRFGAAHLVLGSSAPASRSLASADATWVGERVNDYAGSDVAAPGDVDGDGLADMLVGAYAADDDARGRGSGAAYLILASGAPASGTLGSFGATFRGAAAEDEAGAAVAGAGDVDGDGHADLLFSAPQSDDALADAGTVYLVLGSASPASIGLEAADARFEGSAAYDEVGAALAGAGDTNGDGYADFLVGAAESTAGGQAFLIHGAAVPASHALADASVVISGAEPLGEIGASVAGAGDMDGDGYDDVLIGDGGTLSHTTGTAWLVSGLTAVGAVLLNADDIELVGEAVGDYAGFVSGGADFNGDGYPDVFVGAYGNDSVASMSGMAYVVLGTGL